MTEALQKSLALESALLRRLLCRNDAQHRGSLHHKRALELSRLLRLLGEVEGGGDGAAPSPSTLSRLAATSRICAAVSRASRALASSCSGQLASGFFVPLCSALVAVAARCAAASAALALESARGYNRGAASLSPSSPAAPGAGSKRSEDGSGASRRLPPRILRHRALPELLSVSFPGSRAGAPLVSGVGGGLPIAEEEEERVEEGKGRGATAVPPFQPPMLVLPPPPSAPNKRAGVDEGDDLGVPVSRSDVAAVATAAAEEEEEEKEEAGAATAPPLPVFVDTERASPSGEEGKGKEREEEATTAKIVYEPSAPLLGSGGGAKRPPAAAPPPLLETKSAAKRRAAKEAAAARRREREEAEAKEEQRQRGWESWIDAGSLPTGSSSGAASARSGSGGRGRGRGGGRGGGGGKRRKM